MVDFNYEKASERLREFLCEESGGKCDGFEFLLFYFSDESEGGGIFSDYGREELEEVVKNSISNFECWLKNNATDWLVVGNRYRWVLLSDSKPVAYSPKEKGNDQYTDEEYKLLNKDTSLLKPDDYKLANSLYQRSLNDTDPEKIGDRALRLAWIVDRTDKPYVEKAKYWEAAGDKAGSSSKHLGFSWFLKAAEAHARNFSHFESSRIYEKAIEQGVIEDVDFERLMQVVRACKQQFNLAGDGEGASRVFIKENDMKLNHAKGMEKLFLAAYKYLCRYGEAPINIVLVALVVVGSSSLVYWACGIYSSRDEGVVGDFLTSIYFSLVTFTTLGYGDFSPNSMFVRWVASFEAVSGLLLTSLFLATVIRKYSR